MQPPLDLTCDYASNTINIHTPRPRFGWQLASDRRGQSQSVYQVLVASSSEHLLAGHGDKWDSGKVASNSSGNAPYTGSDLSSDENCWWQVRAWDQHGRPSAYSQHPSFTMGLLNASDWAGGWIGAHTVIASPLLRKTFDLDRPIKRARLHISGHGWYELYLNGRRVGDHVLDPATSDYTQRVLYVTYDVPAQLQQGANAVGAVLGNGWYSEPGWKHRYGDSPRLRMQLNVEFSAGSATAALRRRWPVAGRKTGAAWACNGGWWGDPGLGAPVPPAAGAQRAPC